jgi:hypothetical protein
MRRAAVVLIACLACTKFKNGSSRGMAENAVTHAQATGDATLIGYARQLGEQRDSSAAFDATFCLLDFLDGMEAEATLESATGDAAERAGMALAESAKHCSVTCARSTDELDQSGANAFERQVLADVSKRCESRWGAHQEIVNQRVLEARLPGLAQLGAERKFEELAHAIDAFERDRDQLAQSGNLSPDAVTALTAKTAALRATHADGLARVTAFESDPDVVAARAQLRLVFDEQTLLREEMSSAERCVIEAPGSCDSAMARVRLDDARLSELDAHERELESIIAARREAAGLTR